jgi:hypothetical protein
MVSLEARMNRSLGWLLLALSTTAAATGTSVALRFSDSAAGTRLPAGWKPYAMSHQKRAAPVVLVRDGAATVAHIDADDSAGGIAHNVALPAATELSWRWKVDHSVVKADLTSKGGDDFAARVYVFFDVPAGDLSFGERIKLSLARHVMGENLPTAALCYVWDNRHPIGTIAPNPYYGAVKTVVLQSGDGHAGQWQVEHRNLAADFREAFGHAAPKVTGVAIASDTDNTSGHANAWFGDLTLAPATAPAAGEQTP